MAADLYLPSLIEELQIKLNTHFENALKERAMIKDKNSRHYIHANEKVKNIYKQMWPESCHFHDAYNESSLMWSLGLSWWKDVIPMLNDKYHLTPEKAQELIRLIHTSEIDPEMLNQKYNYEYFLDKKKKLIKFLDQSIEYGELIECSI